MKITIQSKDESQIASWLKTRGGVAVWVNRDLGSPSIGCQSFTPATHEDGSPATPPHWRNGHTPEAIITSPEDVTVQTLREVKRVAVRRGPPYLGGINRADKAKLDAALDEAGDGACYVENYDAMKYGSAWFHAVVMVPSETRPIMPELL